MEAELGVMHPQAKNSFPWSLWRELGPADPLMSGSQPPIILRHPVSSNLWQPQETSPGSKGLGQQELSASLASGCSS